MWYESLCTLFDGYYDFLLISQLKTAILSNNVINNFLSSSHFCKIIN